MTLFDATGSPSPDDARPAEPRHASGGPGRAALAIATVLIGIAVLAAVVVSLLPAPYVLERPGPTFDVLGDVQVDGETVPLISIPGETTYPTDGTLRMTTVTLAGSPDSLPSWMQVLLAWFDPSVAVVPVDDIYPPGVTVEQSTEEAQLEMENSQREAIAAAFTELGIEVDGTVAVEEIIDGSPATGVLEVGDLILSVDGTAIDDVSALRAAIADNGTADPAEIVISRGGEQQTVEVTPVLADDGATPVLQVYVSSDYDFPFTVDIQLQNVGGPSAGMIFALGIVDKLTDGSLTGGEEIAGTGTIAADGTVGPIGGIRQKLYGARNAGSDWFLAPASNCDEVVGHVPSGLTVFAVSTLDEAVAAAEAIRDGDTASLTTCEAVVG